MFGLLLIVVLCAFTAVVKWRAARRESDLFHWQFATYDGGRHVHALPTDGGQHTEDHLDRCRCRPWTERFERSDGSFGVAIYHRRLARRSILA